MVSPSAPRTRDDILKASGALRPDGRRVKIHPAEVTGRFVRLQRWLYVVLIGVYVALPWVKLNGVPLVFIDIEHRRFFLFGHTYDSSDFYLGFFALLGFGLALILMSAVFGRVWCGYACPQTVFLEGVFRRIEALFEGRPHQRQAREKGPWTLERTARFAGKHATFLVLAFVVANIFISYFATAHQVLAMERRPPAENWAAFSWMAAITLAMYFDFAWFREQLCVVLCPYGRLQSVLADRDTIVVGYDLGRGEPRAKRGTAGAGDCVDCRRCVQVCPTGIDIRNGLQLECIGCAHCIDACDEVMLKIDRAPGLIRYDSGRGLEHAVKRFWRPRVFAYLAVMAIGILAFVAASVHRQAYGAALLRAQQTPYERIGDEVVNRFVLHLTSKSNAPRTLKLKFELPPDAHVLGTGDTVQLAPFESVDLPVMIELEHPAHEAHRAELELTDPDGQRVEVSAALLGS